MNASLQTDYYNITECDLIFVDASGDTITGYLNVDSGTLYVDDVNNRVGIGTTSPAGPIEVFTTSGEQIDQQQTMYEGSVLVSVDQWQSFTAGKTGILTKIELCIYWSEYYSGTIYIREGEGLGGDILSSNPVSSLTDWSTIDIEDCNVTAGQKYTIHLTGESLLHCQGDNPYPGGRSSFHFDVDLCFKTYVVQIGRFIIESMTGNVGIGTTSPASGYRLDVEGAIQATAFDVGDITFRDQETQEILWRMFEDIDGLYLENLKTGKVYGFVLREMGSGRLLELGSGHFSITEGVIGFVIALGAVFGVTRYRARENKEEIDPQQSKLSQWQ